MVLEQGPPMLGETHTLYVFELMFESVLVASPRTQNRACSMEEKAITVRLRRCLEAEGLPCREEEERESRN